MVAQDKTRLGCECDHIVLPGLHSTSLWSRRRLRIKCGVFWKLGDFARSPSKEPNPYFAMLAWADAIIVTTNW